MTASVPQAVRRLAATGWGLAAVLAVVPAWTVAASGGEIALGWRDVAVDGERAKYRQHVNLGDGVRLMDFRYDWHRAPPRANGNESGLTPDRLLVRLADLGGDPYERWDLEARRAGRYRARLSRQESEYFYEDLLVLPENASAEASTGGDFRHFDLRRTRDRADLTVEASERATLQLGFDRYRKRGDATTVLDIEREEFELERPVDETMESLSAAVSYAWDKVTATFTERFTRFDYASSQFLPSSSAGSEPDAPSELTLFFLDQPYDLDSREHRLDVRARPLPRLTVDVSGLLGEMDVDLAARERSQGIGFQGAPFSRDLSGEGDIDQDRSLYDLSAAYQLGRRVAVFAGLRRAELDQSGASRFEGAAGSDWDVDTSRLEGGVELTPSARVTLALGWTTERRETRYRQQSPDTLDTDDVATDADGYFLRLTYRPSPRADLLVSVEDNSIDDPFSLASPTDSNRYRVRARYRWDSGLSASASYLSTRRDNDTTGWNADSDELDLRLAYDGTRLYWSAGYARIELNRSVDALVLGGARQALFAIDYGAEANVTDATLGWRLAGETTLGASLRRYDNGGSFAVDRDDYRVFTSGRLGDRYRWGLSWRRIDFAEGGIEDFDADMVELQFGLRW